MSTFTYELDAELPGLTLPWQEQTTNDPPTWTDLDLSSGWTFTLRLVNSAGTDVLTKTTGITGTTTGVTVAWAAGELGDPVVAGSYTLRLRARETATTKDRDYSPSQPVQIVII